MGFDVSFFQLLFKMLAGETGQLSKVDFFPQKPRFGGESYTGIPGCIF